MRTILLLLGLLLSGPSAFSDCHAGERQTPAASPVPELDFDARATPITTAQLSALILGGEHMLLLDARRPDEFEMSHIKEAQLVDGTIDKGELARWVAPTAAGRVIVLLCTFGARGQVAADALLHDLMAAGAKGVHYLEGGLVGWLEHGLPLVSDGGATFRLHPFDAEIAGRLVADGWARDGAAVIPRGAAEKKRMD